MYMKRKAVFIMFLGLIAGAASACAEPEGSNVSAVEESLDKVSNDQLKDEQGRFVECIFEIPEYSQGNDIRIAAYVTIPEHAVEQGSYEQSMIPAEQIENVLLDGQKMEYVNEVMGQEKWEIASEPGSDKAFKVNYMIDKGIQKSFFSNTSVKELADVEYTKNNCPTEEMKEQLEYLTNEAQDVFAQLGMNTEIMEATIGGESGYYTADIMAVPRIDDILLVEPQCGFVDDYCWVSTDGIGGMQMHGIYQKKDAQETSVMSVDDMLQIVKEKAENGEITGWNDVTYTNITLAYYLDSGIFYPVWYIYDAAGIVDICINAQTGTLCF